MKVCFLHAESPLLPELIELQRALAVRMIKSVRKHMDCEIVQLSDLTTPQMPLCDSVHRQDPKGKYWIEFIHRLMAAQSGDVLFLDTDCVVQADVSSVFEMSFDLALTVKRKSGAVYVDKKGKKHVMPWTGGVIFCRKPEFWTEQLERVLKYEDDEILGWWGAAIGFEEWAKTTNYQLLFLDCEEFNYAPKSPDEDLTGRFVVHYKGARKTWNLEGNWQPFPDTRRLVVKFA